MLPTATRHRILSVCAVGLCLAAIYHLAALVWPTIDPSSSPLRHAIFTAINLAVGAGLWLRPRGIFWFFAALTAQQLHSHGRALLRAWSDQHRVDWPSVVVLVALPFILWLLWQERRVPAATGRVS